MKYELHRHLDVSIRTSTLLSLAQERGLVSQSTSFENFKDRFILRQPMNDLSSVLASFSLFQKVLDRPEVCERVAFEAIEDCRAEGTQGVELRFSPAFVSELSCLGWQESLNGFRSGMRKALDRYPEMKAGLICIVSRDYGVEMAEKTVEFLLRNRDSFIALDLAGNETDLPCQLFAAPFKRAREQGIPITVHAGEASGPENIWEAIDLLGASRIGHGISSVRDPELMRVLAERQICLEMCPTSNWLTQCVRDLSAHPLPAVLRAGIPVCINTDDPGIFGVTLPGEVKICTQKMGMRESEIEQCFIYAKNSSFLNKL